MFVLFPGQSFSCCLAKLFLGKLEELIYRAVTQTQDFYKAFTIRMFVKFLKNLISDLVEGLGNDSLPSKRI